jgi:hypothetical protein
MQEGRWIFSYFESQDDSEVRASGRPAKGDFGEVNTSREGLCVDPPYSGNGVLYGDGEGIFGTQTVCYCYCYATCIS